MHGEINFAGLRNAKCHALRDTWLAGSVIFLRFGELHAHSPSGPRFAPLRLRRKVAISPAVTLPRG
jgi:hypothetical protein